MDPIGESGDSSLDEGASVASSSSDHGHPDFSDTVNPSVDFFDHIDEFFKINIDHLKNTVPDLLVSEEEAQLNEMTQDISTFLKVLEDFFDYKAQLEDYQKNLKLIMIIQPKIEAELKRLSASGREVEMKVKVDKIKDVLNQNNYPTKEFISILINFYTPFSSIKLEGEQYQLNNQFLEKVGGLDIFLELLQEINQNMEYVPISSFSEFKQFFKDTDTLTKRSLLGNLLNKIDEFLTEHPNIIDEIDVIKNKCTELLAQYPEERFLQYLQNNFIPKLYDLWFYDPRNGSITPTSVTFEPISLSQDTLEYPKKINEGFKKIYEALTGYELCLEFEEIQQIKSHLDNWDIIKNPEIIKKYMYGDKLRVSNSDPEHIKVTRFGLDVKKLENRVILYKFLHPLEYCVFKLAIDYLDESNLPSGEAGSVLKNNIVICDFFDGRDLTVLKKDMKLYEDFDGKDQKVLRSDGKDQKVLRSDVKLYENVVKIHSIIIWKLDEEKNYLIIDPSQLSFSKFLSNALKKYFFGTFMTLEDFQTIYPKVPMIHKIYEPQKSQPQNKQNKAKTGFVFANASSTDNPIYRDCIDIAVKLGLEILHHQQKYNNIDEILKQTFAQISNSNEKNSPSEIFKAFNNKKYTFRSLQSTNLEIRKHTREVLERRLLPQIEEF